ncbi:MAG: hypothetical protein KJ666_05895 [Bacteroidetes bacterium]|nr:hypothetical protein [Bacteroidota bacterium]MBU2586335.1 hypothetical protein [Bacteroidota bacterium]
MITKQIIKSEIDNVPDQHLDLLYKVVKALETSSSPGNYDKLSWNEFIKQTYGWLMILSPAVNRASMKSERLFNDIFA